MIAVGWVDREPPLPPGALFAEGMGVRAAVAQLVARLDPRWTGVAGAGFLVVVGPELPWIEDVIWLGQDPIAPGVWWPTTRTVDVPVEPVARRIRAMAEGPAVFLPGRIIPLRAARPLERARLEAR